MNIHHAWYLAEVVHWPEKFGDVRIVYPTNHHSSDVIVNFTQTINPMIRVALKMACICRKITAFWWAPNKNAFPLSCTQVPTVVAASEPSSCNRAGLSMQYKHIHICKYMYVRMSYIYIGGGVLKWGYPKSSFWIGFSFINHPFWGSPILGNPHMQVETCISRICWTNDKS